MSSVLLFIALFNGYLRYQSATSTHAPTQGAHAADVVQGSDTGT
jgi:hypothetical protein